jgi:hypothetical protein
MASFTGIAATTAAVANRYVTSTNMIVGAYTLANTTPVWQGGAFVTVTHTAVGAADTLGTIVVVGYDLAGNVRTDTITPVSGSVATGLIPFRTITSITGVGWVINAGNDTIVVGVAAGSIACGTSGTLYGIVVNTTAAATVVLSDSVRTIATLKASIAEGAYIYGPGVDFVGYLKVATTSTNDITAIHSPTAPGGGA